ncbi:MAG: ABC transporter permease [Spirosomataceae bacterium]
MNKIFLIIQREYLTRVKKKSFLLLTFLTPILITAIYAIPVLLFSTAKEVKKITVIDESKLLNDAFKDTDTRDYTYSQTLALDAGKKELLSKKCDVLVYVPQNIMEAPKTMRMFAENGISLDLQSDIERDAEKTLEKLRLQKAGIDLKLVEDAKVNVDADTYNLSEEGEKDSSSGAATAIGIICGVLIYMSIFIYGAQVMRGVMEEKMNRIVEVIVSSVKPFELMLGKIIGLGLVGLTQFLLWIVLTIGITTFTSTVLGFNRYEAQLKQIENVTGQKAGIGKADDPKAKAVQQEMGFKVAKAMKAVKTLPLGKILFTFLFYFLGGYLFYAALFAAVGAAVDSETDTQQFMLPITLPIIISFFFAQYVINEPNGSIAFWASIVPFTSSINMMVRMPYDPPMWEVLLSMLLLVLGFIGTTWLAARIYRVGILMYGKKVNFRELSKWLFYRG